MDVYRSGADVVLNIPLVDDNDVALTPDLIMYKIYDDSQVERQSQVTHGSYTVGDTSVAITVTAAVNQLAAGNLREGRVVELQTMKAGSNENIIKVYFAIEAEFTTVKGVNSYQTFAQAALLTLDMPELTGWVFATDKMRAAAMVDAYNRIGALRFTVDSTDIIGLNELTTAEFDGLSAVFLKALNKAQVSEADIILGGDPIHSKREEGLLSDSTGESAIMFRPGKPLLMSVSRRTLNYLSGFVSYGNSLGRG